MMLWRSISRMPVIPTRAAERDERHQRYARNRVLFRAVSQCRRATLQAHCRSTDQQNIDKGGGS